MSYSLTKTLGTVRWFVFSARYAWIALPSLRLSNLRVQGRWTWSWKPTAWFDLLKNGEINTRIFLVEKFFDSLAVRAPGLWEDDHFLCRNGVLHNIGSKKTHTVSVTATHIPQQIVWRPFFSGFFEPLRVWTMRRKQKIEMMVVEIRLRSGGKSYLSNLTKRAT